jgi:hypothetical protein
MERKSWIVLAITAIIAIVVLAAGYVTIVMDAQTEYNRNFASHVTMAKDSATFENMAAQLTILWENMNTTFAGRDFNTTYSTWWGPDQNYENSLGAQRDYFNGVLDRINNYQAVYAGMSANGTAPGLILDWYDRAIVNLRNEMNRSGDLDWALHGAFYYNLHPAVYWLWAWMFPLVIGIILVGFYIIYRIES